MFLKYFPKGHCRLLKVPLITHHSVTLIPVDYFTFMCDCVLVHWNHKEVSDGVAFFEVHLDAHVVTNVFKMFIQFFDVWHHHVDVVVLVMVVCLWLWLFLFLLMYL